MESFSHLGNFSSVKKTMSQQREDGNLTNEVKRRKADKLAMRKGEMCYEKKLGQLCNIFFSFFYCLTISYNSISIFSGRGMYNCFL